MPREEQWPGAMEYQNKIIIIFFFGFNIYKSYMRDFEIPRFDPLIVLFFRQWLLGDKFLPINCFAFQTMVARRQVFTQSLFCFSDNGR